MALVSDEQNPVWCIISPSLRLCIRTSMRSKYVHIPCRGRIIYVASVVINSSSVVWSMSLTLLLQYALQGKDKLIPLHVQLHLHTFEVSVHPLQRKRYQFPLDPVLEFNQIVLQARPNQPQCNLPLHQCSELQTLDRPYKKKVKLAKPLYLLLQLSKHSCDKTDQAFPLHSVSNQELDGGRAWECGYPRLMKSVFGTGI